MTQFEAKMMHFESTRTGMTHFDKFKDQMTHFEAKITRLESMRIGMTHLGKFKDQMMCFVSTSTDTIYPHKFKDRPCTLLFIQS
jgi:hypothetical protein